MTCPLQTRRIGNSVGVILPKELLDRLHIGEGDTLFASVDQDGLRLTPYDPDFEAAMAAFEVGRRKYRNALRELAR